MRMRMRPAASKKSEGGRDGLILFLVPSFSVADPLSHMGLWYYGDHGDYGNVG